MSAAKRVAKLKPHACVVKVNKLLAEQGDCLQRFISLAGTVKIAVATERLNTTNWRRGSTWLMATFCPFCGERLREPAALPPKKPRS